MPATLPSSRYCSAVRVAKQMHSPGDLQYVGSVEWQIARAEFATRYSISPPVGGLASVIVSVG